MVNNERSNVQVGLRCPQWGISFSIRLQAIHVSKEGPRLHSRTSSTSSTSGVYEGCQCRVHIIRVLSGSIQFQE